MRQVMTPSPHTVGIDKPLTIARALMRTHCLRHLPVLQGGKLVGVLTQRDLYYLETVDGVDLNKDSVADAMTADVYVASPDDPIPDVARVMAAHKYGCAVIVEGGKVVGIFTANDALHHLSTIAEAL